MKIFLVVRGSQGDVYPYLELSRALERRGHSITLSIPREFATHAQDFKLTYIVQEKDDIYELIDVTTGTGGLLDWMQRVIDQQFVEYVPVLKEHDLLIAANTEFAAPHIAEYCRKPIIRTCYAPLLPSKTVFPAVFPIVDPPFFLTPRLMWWVLNTGMNAMMVKIINRNRVKYGMTPIKDQAAYAPSQADNFLMYSPAVGELDPTWPYAVHVAGYCFNDELAYSEEVRANLEAFVKKDARKTIFFTVGSCKHKKRDLACAWLLDLCRRHGYKLVIGAGWWKTGEILLDGGSTGNRRIDRRIQQIKNQLMHKRGEDASPQRDGGTPIHGHGEEDLFILDSIIPHKLIFPLFDAIIHHGGSGTTHSAARAGKPQWIIPILIDQFYWAGRVHALGVSPKPLRGFGALTKARLEAKVLDLLTNPAYGVQATKLAEAVAKDENLDEMCAYVEGVAAAYAASH